MTIFEKILAKEIPADVVYEDDRVLAFKDIAPQAPVHILFIHKEKSENVNELVENNEHHVSELFKAIKIYTESEGLDKEGFRVVTNVGKNGGQTVFYTHFHVLSGGTLGRFGA